MIESCRRYFMNLGIDPSALDALVDQAVRSSLDDLLYHPDLINVEVFFNQRYQVNCVVSSTEMRREIEDRLLSYDLRFEYI